MSGRWTKAAALGLLLVTVAGCSPTAAPNKKGTAAEPLRKATSHVTRGTDSMVRGATHRGTGSSGSAGNWFSGLWGPNRATTRGTGTTNPRLGAGMTRGTHPTPATGRGGVRTGGTGAQFGAAGTRMGPAGTGLVGVGPRTTRMGASSRIGTHGQTGVRGMFGAAGSMGKKPLRVVGFFTEDASRKGLVAIGRDPKELSDLSPWWYTLNSDGSVKDSSTAATRSWAYAHKVPLVPLVTNGGEYKVLEDNTAMHTAIQNLVSLVQKNNYAGLNIDFQGLPFQARTGLNAFVDELSSQMHSMNKTVAVDIIPTQAQTGAHGAYDEVTLSHYADQLILMTYDRHDNTSSPGPVSPHAWVVAAVKHALASGVPASKIVLGVNSYGYDWNVSTGKGTTVGQAQASSTPNSQKSYSSTTKETKVTFTKNGVKHVIYYGGRQALADKIAIAKQYKLAGIAIWKVGYENQAYWQELLKVNGDAASLQQGATSSAAPSAAFKAKKHAKKPITHRPIGTKTGRTSPAKMKKSTGKHAGTSRSQSGTKRGTT